VLLAAAQSLAAQADVLVVEGAGGWMVPLAQGLDTAHLARALGLPVRQLVGLRLGCLNHARLSEQAIRHSGCTLSGWISPGVAPQMALADGNLRTLRKLLTAPCLGHLAFAGTAEDLRIAWPAGAMVEQYPGKRRDCGQP